MNIPRQRGRTEIAAKATKPYTSSPPLLSPLICIDGGGTWQIFPCVSLSLVAFMNNIRNIYFGSVFIFHLYTVSTYMFPRLYVNYNTPNIYIYTVLPDKIQVLPDLPLRRSVHPIRDKSFNSGSLHAGHFALKSS